MSGYLGVGFTPISALIQSRKIAVPLPSDGKAPSFDSLVRPVSNGLLAQRMEPAKRILLGVSGYTFRPGVSGVVESIRSTVTKIGGSMGGSGATSAAALGFLALGSLPGAAATLILGASGLFGGKSESKLRKIKNLSLYGNAWGQAKSQVTDQITRTQRRLDAIDRDSTALDKTLAGLDATLRDKTPLSSVVGAVAQAKGRRDASQGLIDALKVAQDALTTRAATVAAGEQAGQTQPGSDAQMALDEAAKIASGIDAQTTTVTRSLSMAVSVARAATQAVNRWLDQEAARQRAEDQQRAHDASVAEVLRRLEFSSEPDVWVDPGVIDPRLTSSALPFAPPGYKVVTVLGDQFFAPLNPPPGSLFTATLLPTRPGQLMPQ